jgi:hypothetical protein
MMRPTPPLLGVIGACTVAALLGQVVAAAVAPEPGQSAGVGQQGRGLAPLLAMEGDSATKASGGPALYGGDRLTRTEDARTTCVTDGHGSGHCAPTIALDRGLGLGIQACTGDGLAPDDIRVFGALPGDSASAVATTGDGRQWTGRVVSDVVVFEVPRRSVTSGSAVRVGWTTGGRPQSHDLPVPAELAELICG